MILRSCGNNTTTNTPKFVLSADHASTRVRTPPTDKANSRLADFRREKISYLIEQNISPLSGNGLSEILVRDGVISQNEYSEANKALAKARDQIRNEVKKRLELLSADDGSASVYRSAAFPELAETIEKNIYDDLSPIIGSKLAEIVMKSISSDSEKYLGGGKFDLVFKVSERASKDGYTSYSKWNIGVESNLSNHPKNKGFHGVFPSDDFIRIYGIFNQLDSESKPKIEAD